MCAARKADPERLERFGRSARELLAVITLAGLTEPSGWVNG